MKRHVRSAATGAAMIVMLAGTACGPQAEPPMVEGMAGDGMVRLTPAQLEVADLRVEAVSPSSVTMRLDVPGTVASPDTAMAAVGSLVEGRVESVQVVPGDQVSEGDALMRIESHELADALRDRAAAEARLQYAQAALDRSTELLDAGAVSREEVERRRAERDALVAEVARANEWTAHLSPDADGRVVVRAPRDGVVFDVSVRPGAAVTPGASLTTLGRTDVLWITGWVPERELLRVEPGMAVDVVFPALAGVGSEARVVKMGGSVDPVRRAVEVRVELVDVPDGVRPGTFATLHLPSAAPESLVTLPADAVQRIADGEIVFVEEGPGLYRPVAVRSSTLPDGRVVVDGLSEGQRVVVEGAYTVRSAMESGLMAEEEG